MAALWKSIKLYSKLYQQVCLVDEYLNLCKLLSVDMWLCCSIAKYFTEPKATWKLHERHKDWGPLWSVPYFMATIPFAQM